MLDGWAALPQSLGGFYPIMSYDLYFTTPKVSRADFEGYFATRPNYEVANDEAMYGNDDTGVYFSFMHNDGPPEDEDDFDYTVAFNMNYYRPHFFALEAEPEIRAFVDRFSCGVHDDQMDGMGEGAYSREGFLSGWNGGNEFAHRAFLSSEGEPTPPDHVWSKPTDELERIWQWNHAKESRQNLIQEDIFIPRIMMNSNIACFLTASIASP